MMDAMHDTELERTVEMLRSGGDDVEGTLTAMARTMLHMAERINMHNELLVLLTDHVGRQGDRLAELIGVLAEAEVISVKKGEDNVTIS